MPEQDDQPVQEELFQEYRSPEDIKRVQPSVGSAVKNPIQEHVRQFLGLLAASPDDTYAYAVTVFEQAASKVSNVRQAYPSFMPVLLSDLLALTQEANELLASHQASKLGRGSTAGSYQPDTEGRAHVGARREHPLSVLLWDAVLPGYQCVSDFIGVMLIAANAAATPCAKNENGILAAVSQFRHALGQGQGVAKLGGNMLQRVDRALANCTNLSDVHSAFCELRDEFPDEEGIQQLVHGMSDLLEILPKFVSRAEVSAFEGDVRLLRFFTRTNQQSVINVAALDKALYEHGSALEALDEHNRRNDPVPVDMYRLFTPHDCTETTADLVNKYLNLEIEHGSWGWAAGLERIRPGSREYLSADCRYRIGKYLEKELENGSPSIGGLAILLVMAMNREPDQVYDTPCGIDCALTPDGKIRRSDHAIPISNALNDAPYASVKRANDSIVLELPCLVRSYVEKLLGKCAFGDRIGEYLNIPRDGFIQAYADKVNEIKREEHIHELGVRSLGYQLGRFAYTGCRSTVLVNALFGKDSYFNTNCAHYVWIGIDPLSDWYRDSGDAYFRGDDFAPVFGFDACANSVDGIGASIPEIEHLRKFVQSKATSLKKKLSKRRQRRVAYFNELAQFVQFLLQCVTGCHENTDTFAFLSIRASSHANFMTLADKVSHFFDDGRLVFFTDVLRAWIEIYQAEISQLIPWLEKQDADESVTYLRNLLGSIESGTVPAIPHFIQIDEAGLTIQQLTCTTQREWLGEKYPWESVDEIRKVLGTYLFENGVSQDLMNVQMGHVIGGVHPFNNEAFWCVSEAQTAISSILTSYGREIGIKPPAQSMRHAYSRVDGVYDAELEPLWRFSEDKNRENRMASAGEELCSIKTQLDRVIGRQEKIENRDSDVRASILQDISDRLSGLMKYNLAGWSEVVVELRAFVEEIGLEDDLRKIGRVEKASTLSGHDYAQQFDAALNMVSAFHSSLARQPDEDDDRENYELLADLFLLQVSSGAVVNFKLFDLCLMQSFGGLKRNLWLTYWDVYPTESRLRPMRVLLAPLAARVLELLNKRLSVTKNGDIDLDIGRLKRRIHVRLKSLGIIEASYKNAVQRFMHIVTPYWRYKLPPQVLEYYQKPYSVTPTHAQNLYRMLHSGRVPPGACQAIQKNRSVSILQHLPESSSPEELGDSIIDHVANCVQVINGVLKKAGSLRRRDSAKIKEARRLLESSGVFESQGISVLHPISKAAVHSIQSFLTSGTIKRRIEKSEYPSWNAIIRYWEVIHTLASLQAALAVDVKDSQELSDSIRTVIENDGEDEKIKAIRTQKTDSAGLLNYAVACMDADIIATVNSDVFTSLGGDLLPSDSGVLTAYERDEMLRLVMDATALEETDRYRLLLYLVLHFEGLRDEEICEARPCDVLITVVDGELRWFSVSTRFHDDYTTKNTQSNGRVCRNTSRFSGIRREAIQCLHTWLLELQAKGVERIFYDGTASGLDRCQHWLYTQVKVIAREFLADSSFSGHTSRHSVATEDAIEPLISKGNLLSERYIDNAIDIPAARSVAEAAPANWATADPHKLQPVSDKLRHSSTKSTWRYYFSAPEIVLHCYLHHNINVEVPNAFRIRIASGRCDRNSSLRALIQKSYVTGVAPETLNAREDRQRLPFFGPSEHISVPLINRVLVAYAKGGRSFDVVVRSERVSEDTTRRIIDTAHAAESESAFCFYRLTGLTVYPEEYAAMDSRFAAAKNDFSCAADKYEDFLGRATREEIISLNSSLRIWSEERAHTEKATQLQVAGTGRLQAILSLLEHVGQNLGTVVVQHGSAGSVDMDDFSDTVPLLSEVRTFMKCPRPGWVTRGGVRQGIYVIRLTRDRASQFMSPLQLQRFLLVLYVRTSILLSGE